jgi:hypothetical protein
VDLPLAEPVSEFDAESTSNGNLLPLPDEASTHNFVLQPVNFTALEVVAALLAEPHTLARNLRQRRLVGLSFFFVSGRD